MPHETRVRVRFDEVDQMNVVHHPRYLVYFEVARTRWLRDLGVPYAEVVRGGTHLAIIEAGVRYLKPARYDDELVVVTRCTEAAGVRVGLSYEVRRGADLLATGFTRLASIDPSGRAKRMPESLRRTFEKALAAGEGAPSAVVQEENR
jgi:acyl-CoA thioester hydrolase